MATTTIFNWLGSTVSEVSSAITYLVKGTTRAPEPLPPAEQAEVDKYLIEMESTDGLNTSTYGLEWGARSLFCEEPPLNAAQMKDLDDALNTIA
jgi:hypothetical protein